MNNTATLSWRPFFPEATPRPIQVEILDFITSHWDEVDVFAIEAPPGCGKSGIAVALAQWYNAKQRSEGQKIRDCKTYITTTTVALEKQYLDSYKARGLRQLHSASHFRCSKSLKRTYTCEEGRAISKQTKKSCPEACPYVIAKEAFTDAQFGIVNAAYLLTESHFVGALGTRGLLISDEAHTLSEAICNFLEFRISPKGAQNLGLRFPVIPESPEEMVVLLEWLMDHYQEKLDAKILRTELEVEFCVSNPDDSFLAIFSHELTKLKSEAGKLQAMLDNIDAEHWVLERGNTKGQEYFSLTPVTAKGFSGKLLTAIAPKIVLLSATLLDFEYHQGELEINPERIGTYQAPSPFPVANRPIFAIPKVNLNHKDLEASARYAAQIIAPILETHAGERGIIFTSSYAQAVAVRDAVNDLTGDTRVHTHEGAKGKELLLMMHASRKDSVIISPSMHEGVDLKGDMSAFQIVTKLPFPNLGSKVVLRRKELYPGWYNYVTALKLIQATGRSIRTEKDTAVTYILDAHFNWFYRQNKNLFPSWWQEAVEFMQD